MIGMTADQVREITERARNLSNYERIMNAIVKRAKAGEEGYVVDIVAQRREIVDIKNFFEFRGFEVSYGSMMSDSNGNKIYSMSFRW